MREVYIVNLTSATGKVITNQSQIPKSNHVDEIGSEESEDRLQNPNTERNKACCESGRESWFRNICAKCSSYNHKQSKTKSNVPITGGCGRFTGDIRNFCASDCGFRRCNEWNYATSFKNFCMKDCGFRCCCELDCGNCIRNVCSRECGKGNCFGFFGAR